MKKHPRKSLLVFLVAAFAISSCEESKTDPKYTNLKSGDTKDLTIAFTLKRTDATFTGETMVKGKQARVNIAFPGEPISRIRLKSGEVITLMHADKTYKRENVLIDFPALGDKEVELVKRSFPLTYTGKSQEIAGWECSEFLVVDLKAENITENGGKSMRIAGWIAKDFPEGLAIQDIIGSADPIMNMSIFEKLAGKKLPIPGFVMRWNSQYGDERIIQTYTAIKHHEISDTVFEIPDNYLQSLKKP